MNLSDVPLSGGKGGEGQKGAPAPEISYPTAVPLSAYGEGNYTSALAIGIRRVGVGAFKAQGLTISEKWGIIGITVRWRERVAETQLKEDER